MTLSADILTKRRRNTDKFVKIFSIILTWDEQVSMLLKNLIKISYKISVNSYYLKLHDPM
jgi:hypothetical protein